MGRRSIRNCKADRLSSLPDEVLSHILSFLPLKVAAETSILSKRWRNLWTTVTNLHCDCDLSGLLNPDDDLKKSRFGYARFVDRVLISNSAQIQKFSLSCYSKIDPNRLAILVSEAIRRDLRELELCIYGWSVELPMSLFTCNSLEVLELHGKIDIPDSFRIPNLKVLDIDLSGSDLCLRFMQNLFSGCPGLEDVILMGFLDIEQELIFDLSAPALKRLKLRLSRRRDVQPGIKFVLNTPHLQYLDLKHNLFASYFVENLSSPNEAIVDVGYCYKKGIEYANWTFELLRQVTSVKSLLLDSDTMAHLRFANDINIPMFHNLTRLEVVVHDCCGWKLLPGFLESSPNLEVLILYKGEENECLIQDNFDWDGSQSVPNCLSLKLKEIKIEGFKVKGKENELKLVRYLLGNAEVLKILTIDSSDLALEEEVKFAKKLLSFARGSRACEIQFLGDFFSKF